MDTASLVGQTLEAVLAFPGSLAHPAWADELTTPIVTMAAFLQVKEAGLVRVLACEVSLEGERYPALGLSFEPSASDSLQVAYQSGHVARAVPLPETAQLGLPAKIRSASDSDVLGEGCINQCVLALEGGGKVLLRHIMPPETLGLIIESPRQAPNNSSKPTPLRGAA